jgi:hypothetical protein
MTAYFHAVFAALSTGGDILNLICMVAGHGQVPRIK